MEEKKGKEIMGIGSSHKLLVRLAVATVITAVFSYMQLQ